MVIKDPDIRPKLDQSEAGFYLLDANRRFNFSFQEKQTLKSRFCCPRAADINGQCQPAHIPDTEHTQFIQVSLTAE